MELIIFTICFLNRFQKDSTLTTLSMRRNLAKQLLITDPDLLTNGTADYAHAVSRTAK